MRLQLCGKHEGREGEDRVIETGARRTLAEKPPLASALPRDQASMALGDKELSVLAKGKQPPCYRQKDG